MKKPSREDVEDLDNRLRLKKNLEEDLILEEDRAAAAELVKDLSQEVEKSCHDQVSGDLHTSGAILKSGVMMVSDDNSGGKSGSMAGFGGKSGVAADVRDGASGEEDGMSPSINDPQNVDGGPWTLVRTRSRAQMRQENQKGDGLGLQPPHG
ncbi:hypothetical protein RIF29_38366 [Crotalaria pallida]|uniref:Uncharacterized protein n=1 Tax=Crotalaria pallida TaxID=3830 RepID=A0AAN9DZK7_CROPI